MPFHHNTEIVHCYSMPYIDYEMTCPWRHAGKRRKDSIIRRLLPTIISLTLYSGLHGVPQARQSEGCWQDQISGWSTQRSCQNLKPSGLWQCPTFRGIVVPSSCFPRRRRHCGPPKLAQRTWHLRRRESSRYETPNSSRYMERWVGP